MRTVFFILIALSFGLLAGVSITGPAVKRVSVNGAELSYVEKGSVEPVLLIHGSLGSLTMWSAQVDALAKKYCVIAYGRRFHTPNKPPAPEDPTYSYQLHAEDAAELKMPALLMEGEKTLVDFRLINDEFERCLPNGQRVRIPGAGHGSIYEDAAAVSNALLDFLGKQSPCGAPCLTRIYSSSFAGT